MQLIGKSLMDPSRTIRLLVVEDDPAYMYLIKKAFIGRTSRTRWELTTAADGEQATKILFAEEVENAPLPELILLDWNLPRISGGEVLRRLKQHRKLRRIPVLVFSSSEEDDDIHAAYDDYANGYITKPSGGAELEAIVETIERFWIAVAQLPKMMRA
jgi:two-component system, chemotaxis family, response regulator Rcp1